MNTINNIKETITIYNLYAPFEDIASLLAYTLSTRGYTIIRSKVIDASTDKLYILFGNNVWYDKLTLPRRYIIFQLEQHTIKRWFTPNYLSRLSTAIQVWDYNLENIEMLKSNGIDAIHIPIGYSILHDNITPLNTPQDIDVLFLGELRNLHRKNILDRLITDLDKYKFKVMTSSSIYGDEKKKITQRAKVVLNLHHGGKGLLEEARIIPLLSQGKIVVSETVEDSRYVEIYKDNVIFIDGYEELLEKVIEVLTKSEVERIEECIRIRNWVMENRNHYKIVDWEKIERSY